LTQIGEKQAGFIAEWFAEQKEIFKVSNVMYFTSPLQRAFKTLMIAAEPLGIKKSKVIIDPHLREPGNIDCKTPLFSGQPKHYEAGFKDAIVKPNMAYIQPLLQSVLDEEFPINEENFEFREQVLIPGGKYKLSKTLFEKLFSDLKKESLKEGKNIVIIGGHSLFIKNGLASILSEKLTNIHQIKEKSKKAASKVISFFNQTLNKGTSKEKKKKETIFDDDFAQETDEFEENVYINSKSSINNKIYTIWEEEWKQLATKINGSVLNFSLIYHEDDTIEVGFPEIVFACPSISEEEEI